MSPLIEPEVLATLLNDERIVIIDARYNLSKPFAGHALYNQNHLPGAFYAHLEDDLSGTIIPGKTGRHPLPEPDVFAVRVRFWGIDDDAHVVVYDDGSHAMAARAWWQLRWIGVKHVSVLHGGFKAWLAGRYPLTSERPEIRFSHFISHLHDEETVSAQDILNQLDEPRFRLVDARSYERFAGESEPIDARAGHIPGALCHPFSENMDDDGRFLAADRLRQTFNALLPSDLKPVFYCGSGVTACHNLLAMEYAGLPGAKLYPGSWSEWITDGTRPVAVVDRHQG
ncbi:sulfurtransferase [Endozoicomonas euniceicola]|uniref:Sulfurtransferase n=1 Tax=Endozoicomonas euniceicola TaxID=1234143 RepID=A0ABY6GT56_9GAMM|nr:sulfurtransferase [Endozoicomonas euniceicola]UYM15238.1 sulfurtransferase [Endozoicomonas euniceicola]